MIKKTFKTLILFLLISTLLFSLFACDSGSKRDDDEEHVHKFGEWESAPANESVSCENRLYYRVCSKCDLAELKHGSSDDHEYSNKFFSNFHYHWQECVICKSSTLQAKHWVQNGKCTVCEAYLGDLEKIMDCGKIVVGMECAYAPYNWATTTQTENTVPISNLAGSYADGFDVQIAKLIAEGLGVDLEIKAITWDGLIPALENGEIDMIIAGMSPTEERKLSIDFSDTYFDSNLVMVVKAGGAYASADDIQDFAGAKITGQLNTFHYTVIDQITGVQKQTALEDFAALIQSLNSGAIDGYVCEKPGAISAVAANDGFAFVEFEEGKGFTCDPAESSISVGLRKDSSLTAKVNEILGSLNKDAREALMNAAIARQPAEPAEE